jgi:uncharacterized protein
MKFEWNEQKNQLNKNKHGISFEEAKEIFDDPFQLSKLDYRFSYGEERWITIGVTKKGHLLVVANVFFSEKNREIIRIISARLANLQEKKYYENH